LKYFSQFIIVFYAYFFELLLFFYFLSLSSGFSYDFLESIFLKTKSLTLKDYDFFSDFLASLAFSDLDLKFFPLIIGTSS